MEKITYKDAGVDTVKAGAAISNLKHLIASTNDENVLEGIGSFGSMYSIGDNVLVSGTDGVGTKLMLAKEYNNYKNIGYDLVAMCVNDIICHGAKPLFFLDYVAMGKLQDSTYEQVIKSIVEACKLSGLSLVGGESAEMPGMYDEDELDLAGFCVGMVERDKLITGQTIKANDAIIGIRSNGLHSNGYSLVRKIIKKFPEEVKEIKEEFLKPTFIYTKVVKDLMGKLNVKGLAHITGGGFYENIPRVMPKGLNFKISKKLLHEQKVFTLLTKLANLDDNDSYSTFNMGYGMTVVVDKSDVDLALNCIKKSGFSAELIGEVIESEKGIIE